MASERAPGDADFENQVRALLIGTLGNITSVEIVHPHMISKGRPAFILGTSDGTYVVSVERVSHSVSEAFRTAGG